MQEISGVFWWQPMPVFPTVGAHDPLGFVALQFSLKWIMRVAKAGRDALFFYHIGPASRTHCFLI
jgi:hypothetical protein